MSSAPIERIPPEILSIIFLHLVPPFGNKNPERVPVILGQVSRLWRALTLTLPGIWASLDITCNHHIFKPPLHTIHTHLLRSAAHPLSIILNTKYSGYLAISPSPHFPAVLAALVAARDRWHHVSVTLASGTTWETLNMIIQGDAPLLQSFHCEYPSWGMPSVPLHALQGCPRLESLTWSCIQTQLTLILAEEAWSQLTTLRLESTLTTSDCLTLLQLSPRLSTAWFRGVDSLGTAESSGYVFHATLHTFHTVGACVAGLIDALILPALEDLVLDAPHPSSPHTALHDFLVRSAPPLRTLFLANLGAPEPGLIRALALAGDLETLSVVESSPDSAPFTAALIHALHPFPLPGPRPLCPRLSALQIETLNALDGVCESMLRARRGAEARDNGVAGLREVYIVIEDEEEEHERDRAEMEKLNAEVLKRTLPRPRWGGRLVIFAHPTS